MRRVGAEGSARAEQGAGAPGVGEDGRSMGDSYVAGGRLMHIPTRFLTGQLPEALLECFEFWQLHHINGQGRDERSERTKREHAQLPVQRGDLLAKPTTEDTYFQYTLHVLIEPKKGGSPAVHAYRIALAVGGGSCAAADAPPSRGRPARYLR